MRTLVTLTCFVFLISFSSCKHDCNSSAISFVMVGYDSSEVTEVIIRQYEKYTNLTKLDTTVYTSTNNLPGHLHFSYLHNQYVLPYWGDIQYDYIIEVTSTGRKYKVTGLRMEQTQTQEDNICYDPYYWYVDDKPGSNVVGYYNNSPEINLQK